jgi:UPF0755 protein
MSFRPRRALAAFGLATLLLAGMASAIVFLLPNPSQGNGGTVVLVPRGSTYAAVIDSLTMRGVLRNPTTFRLAARILGGGAVRSGKHLLPDGLGNAELVEGLRTGRFLSPVMVTVPEGVLARTQARIFARALGIDSTLFMHAVHDSALVRSLGITGNSLEGYLLPDTYGCEWDEDEGRIVARMVKAFLRFYGDSLRMRQEELGWTRHQVMTLASIIEGEAILDAERGRISGVYHNRLRRHMRLEADPTIQFLLENGPRRLRYPDLQIASPYNTYRVGGLPPGPVNNPGRASILAALYPERHAFLFFVANGRGGHWFSATYADHLRYVRVYRRQRASARWSS